MSLMPPSMSTNSGILGIRVLFHHNRQLPDGKATVQVSTDPALLKRALKTSLTNIMQMIQLLLLLLTYCYSITMI